MQSAQSSTSDILVAMATPAWHVMIAWQQPLETARDKLELAKNSSDFWRSWVLASQKTMVALTKKSEFAHIARQLATSNDIETAIEEMEKVVAKIECVRKVAIDEVI